MRFGTWREAPLVLSLAALVGLSLCATAEAGGWPFHTTLPREVPAYDFNTGGPYYAPPVPYGHYAKDPVGNLAKGAGLIKGSLMGLGSHLSGAAHGLGGGLGLGHGAGCGDGCGHDHGWGLGNGTGCGHGLGGGCGFCSGRGLLGGLRGAGAGLGHGLKSGICDPNAGRVKNFGPYHPTGVVASGQAVPSAQTVVQPSGQALCGGPGVCGLKNCSHGGLLGKLRCRLCGGNGCGGCGGLGVGDPCSNCGGNGCGRCGGCGLLSRLGQCPFCGGAGCGHCGQGLGHGLGSKLHGLITSPMGLLHGPKYKWFVGAGGPVPLTPGYVPYIVTTRSPRDFFAFPPKNPDAF